MFANKKAMMRKAAMDSMMKEKPSFPMKSKKERMMEEMDIEAKDEQGGEEETEGFVSFMVTPAEKAMIMKMRKGAGFSEDGEEDAEKMEA